MVNTPGIDLSFRVPIGTEALSYRLGFAVQSVIVGVFSTLGAVHEFFSICFGCSFWPFMSDIMSRAMFHCLFALMSFGFCGGIGFYGSCVSFLFCVICYIAATIEAWNSSDAESEGGHGASS
jgi:hypothetical protein